MGLFGGGSETPAPAPAKPAPPPPAETASSLKIPKDEAVAEEKTSTTSPLIISRDIATPEGDTGLNV